MKHQIVVVGGGSAGIAVAATLLRKNKSLDIAIVDPSDTHYYQPAFTLVGGGAYSIDDTKRDESRCIPAGAQWIQEAVESFDPQNNTLTTTAGTSISYEYLVVCPGIQLDWTKVKGLEDTIGKNGVCSNYLPEYATYTWECIENFKGGNAIFTQPPMPIKCAGAPQKIMYMAANHFQRNSIAAAAVLALGVEVASPRPKIFSKRTCCSVVWSTSTHPAPSANGLDLMKSGALWGGVTWIISKGLVSRFFFPFPSSISNTACLASPSIATKVLL